MKSITPRSLDRTATSTVADVAPTHHGRVFAPLNVAKGTTQPADALKANFDEGATQSAIPKFEDYGILDTYAASDSPSGELKSEGDDSTQCFSKNVRRHG